MSNKKRFGGGLITVDEVETYLVISESERPEDDERWIHECGNDVESSTVTLSHRLPKDLNMPLAGDGRAKIIHVPFCPQCEYEPTRGVFYDSGDWHINNWDQSEKEEE